VRLKAAVEERALRAVPLSILTGQAEIVGSICKSYEHRSCNRLPTNADNRQEVTAVTLTYPPPTPEIAKRRRDLAPNQQAAFDTFSKAAFADGALAAKFKQIIAVAVAHVTQCPYCITGHTRAALRAGATPQELMEAIWVAAEMRAGGAYAHSILMLATLAEDEERRKSTSAR